MAVYTQTITRSVSGDGGSVTGTLQQTADGLDLRRITVAPNAADAPIAFALDVSQAKQIILKASAAMSIAVNDLSTGTPSQTITLAAGYTAVWSSQDPVGTCPFSADVTGLFVTSTPGGTLEIGTLVDSTL